MASVTPVTRAASTSTTGSHIVPLLRRLTLIVASAAVTVASGLVPAHSAFANTVSPPNLVGPANNTNTPLKDVILRWTHVPGASQYQVQVSPNINFTNNAVSLPKDGVTVNTLYEVPLSLPHSTYYWRVRAEVAGAWSNYTSPWQFLREWEQPLTILQQPTTADPTLSWAPVPEASLYRVDFFTQRPQFPDDVPQVFCYTSETSYTPDAVAPPGAPFDAKLSPYVAWPDAPCTLGDGSYYWRVDAFDDTGDAQIVADTVPATESACAQLPECDASTLTTAAGGPFTYASPVPGTVTATTITGLATTWHTASTSGTLCDATTACPMTPTFSWSPVSGVACYIVTVYRDPDATNTYWRYFTSWPRLTPQDAYLDAQPGKPYYWRVSAPYGATCVHEQPTTCPASSGTGGGTGSGTSATPPNVTAVNSSPSGPAGSQSAQGGTTTTVTLSGTGFVSGACVASSAGQVTNVVVESATQLAFTYAAPSAGGAVTFTVQNTDGGTSAASPTLTVYPAPEATSDLASFDKRSIALPLISPAPGATEHGTTFTFKWDALLPTGAEGGFDARNYDLQVSTDPSFATTVLDDSTIDLTQYTPTTSTLSDGHYYWRVAPLDEDGNLLTWSATRQVTVDATGPTFSFASPSGLGVTHPLVIGLSEPVGGVDGSTLKVVPDGSPVSRAVAGSVHIGSSPTRYVFTPRHPLATGGMYDLWVSPFLADANGNPAQVAGNPIRMATTARNGSPGWSFSHGWTRHAASGALSRSYKSASTGGEASLVVAGSVAGLYACKGPNMGTVDVAVGNLDQVVSEHQSFTRCGVLVWHHALPSGEQRLVISVDSGQGNIDAVKVS
jgi:hypothetical protein